MEGSRWMAALALLPLVAAPAWSAGTDYDELSEEYDVARRAHSSELRALYRAEDMEGVAALRKENPAYAFLPRFQAGAGEHAGTDDAVPFLAWVVQNGAPGGAEDAEPALEALATVQAAHLESEAIASLVPRLPRAARTLGTPRTIEFLDAVVAGSPHVYIQAGALFARGNIRLSDDPSAEERALALADMRRVIELDPDSETGKRAVGTIFEAERLQIGMVAPDIEGDDLLGVSFKLSDYRGKVVVIDFWGDW